MKRIELRIKEDLWKELPAPTKENPEAFKRKLVKKGVITKVKPYLEDIRLVGTVVNDKGVESKKYCKIYVRDIGFIVVNHSFEEIDAIQESGHMPQKSVGFQQKVNKK